MTAEPTAMTNPTTTKTSAKTLGAKYTRAYLAAVTIFVALLLAACAHPSVPVARSSTQPLVTATPVPTTPTPTALAIPTATPLPVLAPTPIPVRHPGLTEHQIRIAMIADDETAGVSDGIYSQARLGISAWVAAVNSSGGIGGRKVQLDLLDSRVFDHKAQLEAVCKGDYFALVGSQSLGDHEAAELLGTENCNLADFPGSIQSARRSLSPVTFVANPAAHNVRQAGPARQLVNIYPDASQKVGMVYFNDLELAHETERIRETIEAAGMEVIAEVRADLETDAAQIATELQTSGAQAWVHTGPPQKLIELLRASNNPPIFVLCGPDCYSQAFIREGGYLVEGVYTWIPHISFDSPSAPVEFANYRYWLAQTAPRDGWSEVSLNSWIAGLYFEATFNKLLEIEPGSPGRAQLVAAAVNEGPYGAKGIYNLIADLNWPTPCYTMLSVTGQRWTQEHPFPPLEQDCGSNNLHELVATANLGLQSDSIQETPADTEKDTSAPKDSLNAEEQVED